MSKNTGLNKNKDDMIPARWRYLKQKPEVNGLAWRFVHISTASKSMGIKGSATLVTRRQPVESRHESGARMPKDITIPRMASLPSCVSYGLRR